MPERKEPNCLHRRLTPRCGARAMESVANVPAANSPAKPTPHWRRSVGRLRRRSDGRTARLFMIGKRSDPPCELESCERVVAADDFLHAHTCVLLPERQMGSDELREDAIEFFRSLANAVTEVMLVIEHDVGDKTKIPAEESDEVDADPLIPRDRVAPRRGESGRSIQEQAV